jgi:hypothetical protein
VLQDFRPDAVLIAEYRELFGVDPPGGVVPRDWRERSRLAPARVAPPDAGLADADDVALRQRFEYDEAPLLAEHGLSHFDVSALRSRQRAVTQRFSAWLYDDGHAGIAFRSNVDGEPCGALFEERAALVVDSPVEPIDDLDELPAVLDELRLTLA